MVDDVFNTLCSEIEKEMATLKTEISEKTSRLKKFEQQVALLKKYQQNFKEIQDKYDKEQERLTKLYHEYERSEEECEQLRKELKGWKDWVESNKDLYDRLFSAAPPKISPSTEK